MKEINVKTILNVYSCIEALIEQIDVTVEKKAINSMWDFSPAIEQCNKVVELMVEKRILIELKKLVKKSLVSFDEYEMKCLEYKYFRNKSKKDFEDFDVVSRGYFRAQKKIVEKLCGIFEVIGLTDEYFNKYLIRVPFIKEVLKRTKAQEDSNSAKCPKGNRERYMRIFYTPKENVRNRRICRLDRKESVNHLSTSPSS